MSSVSTLFFPSSSCRGGGDIDASDVKKIQFIPTSYTMPLDMDKDKRISDGN